MQHCNVARNIRSIKRKVSMNCIKNETLSNDCYEAILETMAEGVLLLDTSGIIRFCNHGLETLSGFAKKDIIGKQCSDIMFCSCGSTKECSLFVQGTLNNIECQLKCADGTRIWILKNGRVLTDTDGTTKGAVETLTDITALKNEQRKNAALTEMASRESGRLDLIIGKSRPMQDVFDLINLAANSQATVLVTGETGTGKELVARTIHDKSARKNGPLVKVNCSALPETLLESELFGHVRGSFTGAVKDKVGRFEMADGGTLFLDEIGELSAYIQVKLLRFLQEHEFERVGESITRKSDVRVIVATHRDLREEVAKGTFREDLFYRLKVFPIHLPTLRQRKDDVGRLIRHFIDKFNKQTGKNIAGITPEAAITLMDYCWPGNIRELENAIEHAFVTCGNSEIGLFDLPLEIRHVELRPAECRKEPIMTTFPSVNMMPTPKVFSKEMILSTLGTHHGNRNRTAAALGIDRTTLWRQMKKLGLET